MPDISISSESSAINHCNTIHVQKAFHLCSLCILHHTRYSNKTTARHTLLLDLHSVILLHSAFPNTTQSTKMTTTATIGYMLQPQCQSRNWSQSWRFCTSSELLMLPSLMVSKPFVPVGKTVGQFLGEPDARWIAKRATQTQNLPSCVLLSFLCWKIHALSVPNASGFLSFWFSGGSPRYHTHGRQLES